MCPEDADPILCRCLQVTRSQVVDCIAVSGAETVLEVRGLCGAGAGCLACHCRIKELLATRTRANAACAVRG